MMITAKQCAKRKKESETQSQREREKELSLLGLTAQLAAAAYLKLCHHKLQKTTQQTKFNSIRFTYKTHFGRKSTLAK